MKRPIVPENLGTIGSVEELESLQRDLDAFVVSEARSGELSEDGQLAASQSQAVGLELVRRQGLDQFGDTLLGKVDEKLDARFGELTELIKGIAPAAPAAPAEGELAEGEGGDAPGEGEGGDGGEVAAEGEGGDAGGEGGEAPVSTELGADPDPTQLGNPGYTVPAKPKGAPGALGDFVGAVVTAAKDFASGDQVTTENVAEFLHEIAKTMPATGSTSHTALRIPLPDVVELTGDQYADEKIWKSFQNPDWAVDEVAASGGWGTPSEIRYGFFNISAVDGMVDVPSVGVNRGGLKYPVSPAIADYLPTTNTGIWTWSEDDDIEAANNPHLDPEDDVIKPRFKIPVPTFTDVRLAFDGVALDCGNLVNMAWPELIRLAVKMTLEANDHTINSRRLTAMAAGGTAVDLTSSYSGLAAEVAIVNGFALKRETYVGKYRMDENSWFDAVLPTWVPKAIAKGLGLRANDTDREYVEASLRADLARNMIRVQFVKDWQMLSSTATAWPTSVYGLLYPPGTWVEGRGPTLDLGVTRDRDQIDTNDHTALWTESARSLMKIGHESLTIQFPVVTTGASTAPA